MNVRALRTSRPGPARGGWGGVPKVAREFLPWPIGVLVVAPMGWCSRSWGGVPKRCPRIPAARWCGVPKVGVVFQNVVPEPPLCILLM